MFVPVKCDVKRVERKCGIWVKEMCNVCKRDVECVCVVRA